MVNSQWQSAISNKQVVKRFKRFKLLETLNSLKHLPHTNHLLPTSFHLQQQ